MKRKIIENYALNEIVGEGMYGTVYKASHLQTNEEFAVKVVPVVKFQQNSKLQQGTVNEIKILETIQKSPYIIKYIEMLKTSNNFYFVYELCDGGTLDHRLKQQSKLCEKEALKVFRQLLEAFKVLNKYNIMHRDLKPDNIFFKDGCLKLGDFGFCKTLRKPDDMASTMLGSPIYMAPQVLKGEAYTSKSDIWSLGVVLYEMLFGFCPFQSNSIAKLITVLADTELRIPLEVTNITPATQSLIKRILVKDQSKRIEWFQLLNYDISQDGVISEPNKYSTFEHLKLLTTQGLDYQRKQSLESGCSTPVNSSSSSELMFKKKAEIFAKSNNDLSRGVVQSSTISPKKKGHEESLLGSGNILRRVSSDEVELKRKNLLEQHLNCINAVKTAINFLRVGEVNGLIYALILFKKIEEKLRRLCDSIHSEILFEDISQALSSELKQIQKQHDEVMREIKNNRVDYSQANSPRTLLRQRYSNHKDEVNGKLWYQLILFINQSKPNPSASSYDWESTIENFVN